jgi:hypothetical protein
MWMLSFVSDSFLIYIVNAILIDIDKTHNKIEIKMKEEILQQLINN